MKKIISNNEKETIDLGEEIGRRCQGGEILFLQGDLGSGKTYLSKGIARGLGIKEVINSPTFNIMKIYKVNKRNIKTFCHIDAYRLDNNSSLDNVGIFEYLGEKDVVSVMEWPDNIKESLYKYKVKIIKLKLINKQTREIKIYERNI